MKPYFIVCLFAFIIFEGDLLAQSGKQQLREAENLYKQAGQLHQQGKYEEALSLLKRALVINEKNLGSKHSDAIVNLINIAVLYKKMGKYNESISFYKRALVNAEKLDQENSSIISCLEGLANINYTIGNYRAALTFYERMYRINVKTLGINNPKTIIAITNIAETYRNINNYSEAERFYRLSLNLSREVFGNESLDLADALNNFGMFCKDTADFNNSVSAYEEALLIKEKKLGKNHPNVAQLLNNLAQVYDNVGEHAKALPLFERAVAINTKSLGENHFHTGITLNNLADTYVSLGNPDKALSIKQKVAKNFELNLGPNHPDYAKALHNLALSENLELDRKISLYEKSLIIKQNSLGENHESTATTISCLAGCYGLKGEDNKQLEMLEKALNIREKIYGTEHPAYAKSLELLGDYYYYINSFSKAIPYFDKALSVYEKSYSIGHPDISKTLNYLSFLNYLNDSLQKSQQYAIINITSKIKAMESILTLDEQFRLSWQYKNISFDQASFLPPEVIADYILKTKSIVLDSLSEDRALAQAAGSSGDGAKLLQEIKSLQIKLSKISFEKGKEDTISILQDEIGRLQRELTSKYLGRERKRASASITMAEIMPALAGGAVLVDFIQFNDPKLKADEATCLGAIITGEDNKPVFVRIDGGTAINRSTDALRAAINQGNSSEVEAQTQFLSQKLWSPIAAKIPEGTKRLFLCPDANLNFLSFAALLESDGRFVAEKYPITYIGSARDLAKISSGKISKSMAVVANPQFDAAAKNAKITELVAMRSAEADVFGSIALPPLPGTEAEATSLQALAAESGWQTKSYLGKDATETSVRNTKKPGVLHLATHGFYLNSFTPPGPEGSRGMSVVGVKETTEQKKKKEKGVDPMRASGVAFTGAQQTLTSWSQRKAPNPETDGVLTAEEVGALRLDGTWMVVLSACETGLGEARSGEGVFGLRRAFMIAGAENLLMTLWPVADETTAKIMADFYKEAFATGDASGSLAKVQRDWLVKLRQERGILAAVRDAGPFAMVTMTNPNAQREFVEGPIEVTPEKAAMPKSDKILEFEVALAKANSGDAYAQAIVSIYYGLGMGCEPDQEKSKEYVMLSAKQNNPLGIYRLAEMRETGEGMDQNTEQAMQLMEKAKPGLQKLSSDPYALTALATIYQRENPESAKILEVLTKATEMGYEPAREKLTLIQTNQ